MICYLCVLTNYFCSSDIKGDARENTAYGGDYKPQNFEEWPKHHPTGAGGGGCYWMLQWSTR